MNAGVGCFAEGVEVAEVCAAVQVCFYAATGIVGDWDDGDEVFYEVEVIFF